MLAATQGVVKLDTRCTPAVSGDLNNTSKSSQFAISNNNQNLSTSRKYQALVK